MQPAHVEIRSCATSAGVRPGLALLGETVADEVDGLVELVDHPRSDGVEAMSLAADCRSRDREHPARGDHSEDKSDAVHAKSLRRSGGETWVRPAVGLRSRHARLVLREDGGVRSHPPHCEPGYSPGDPGLRKSDRRRPAAFVPGPLRRSVVDLPRPRHRSGRQRRHRRRRRVRLDRDRIGFDRRHRLRSGLRARRVLLGVDVRGRARPEARRRRRDHRPLERSRTPLPASTAGASNATASTPSPATPTARSSTCSPIGTGPCGPIPYSSPESRCSTRNNEHASIAELRSDASALRRHDRRGRTPAESGAPTPTRLAPLVARALEEELQRIRDEHLVREAADSRRSGCKRRECRRDTRHARRHLRQSSGVVRRSRGRTRAPDLQAPPRQAVAEREHAAPHLGWNAACTSDRCGSDADALGEQLAVVGRVAEQQLGASWPA